MFLNNDQVDKFLSFYEMVNSQKGERNPFEVSPEFNPRNGSDREEADGSGDRNPFEISPDFNPDELQDWGEDGEAQGRDPFELGKGFGKKKTSGVSSFIRSQRRNKLISEHEIDRDLGGKILNKTELKKQRKKRRQVNRLWAEQEMAKQEQEWERKAAMIIDDSEGYDSFRDS